MNAEKRKECETVLGGHNWDYSVETTRPLNEGEEARICTHCLTFEVLKRTDP
ncbi:MAG: hypothetical protein KGJ23_07955 [Euryarchaeota archaeon]|nr:hypothetical protein [Euryarchaeota archaeon]MDE1836534.1 hypothetical protein [Euryarchaeota archaeon]MDE1879271.1 hypothetical protein [Euryarchaeota archaeon]MDE2044504.1 hypothetical protein [Thermoplasmata archaeon]